MSSGTQFIFRTVGAGGPEPIVGWQGLIPPPVPPRETLPNIENAPVDAPGLRDVNLDETPCPGCSCRNGQHDDVIRRQLAEGHQQQLCPQCDHDDAAPTRCSKNEWQRIEQNHQAFVSDRQRVFDGQRKAVEPSLQASDQLTTRHHNVGSALGALEDGNKLDFASMQAILEYVYKCDDPLVYRQLTGDIVAQIGIIEDRLRDVAYVKWDEVKDHELVRRFDTYINAWSGGKAPTIRSFLESSSRRYLSAYELLRQYALTTIPALKLRDHERVFLCAEFNTYPGNKMAISGNGLKL